MAKDTKTSTKSTVQHSSTKSVKKSPLNKDKERAYIKKTVYQTTEKKISQHTTFTCSRCSKSYMYESGLIQHHQTCGKQTNKWCSEISPTASHCLPVEKHKKTLFVWEPKYLLTKYKLVITQVNPEPIPNKTEMRWVPFKKFESFKHLLEGLGESLVENDDDFQVVDDLNNTQFEYDRNYEDDVEPVVYEY